MKRGVQRVSIYIYFFAYGVSFILVFFNFAFTVLYLDQAQRPNDHEGSFSLQYPSLLDFSF